MRYHPIYAITISFLLIAGLITVLLSVPSQVIIQEEDTPYHQYEKQFAKEQDAFDTTGSESVPQLFASAQAD